MRIRELIVLDLTGDPNYDSGVGSPTFYGTGLDDMSTKGTFTGFPASNYRIEIDSVGTPDTFKWSVDDGLTWEATEVDITGSDQELKDGVIINFGATTGHTLNEYWTFLAKSPAITLKSKNIGSFSFVGTGLDDMTVGGVFKGTAITNYKIEIDGTGTPDTFKWSDDGGIAWEETGVQITGSDQGLNNGLTIKFAATTGHTLGDYWTFVGNLTKLLFTITDKRIIKRVYVLGDLILDDLCMELNNNPITPVGVIDVESITNNSLWIANKGEDDLYLKEVVVAITLGIYHY